MAGASCLSCSAIQAEPAACPPGHHEVTAAPSQTPGARAVGCVDAHGAWDGPYREVFENGSLAVQGHYRAGMAELDWEFRYPNGSPMQTGHFLHDRRKGAWTYFDEHGARLSAGPFHEDLQDGYWQTWYPDGARKSAGAYQRGEEEGPWTFWFPNGQVESTGEFHGRRVDPPRNAPVPARTGLWQYWYENGARRMVGCFDHGTQVGTWTQWPEHGDVPTVVTYGSASADCPAQPKEIPR